MPTQVPTLAVIPAFQAESTLGKVIEAAASHLPVLVVDDGSTDGTAMAAERAGARVLRQSPNQGKGAALRAGFAQALGEGVTVVVTLDADGQHDPACIPDFLACWQATRAPLVIGRRDFGQMPMSRRIANMLGTRVFSWAVGRPVADNQSGYRLIGPPLLPRLLGSREAGFEFEVEMITLAIRAGLDIGWVPIPTIYGDQGSHIRPHAHVVNFLRVARDARRSVGRPLTPDEWPMLDLDGEAP